MTMNGACRRARTTHVPGTTPHCTNSCHRMSGDCMSLCWLQDTRCFLVSEQPCLEGESSQTAH